MHDHLYAARGRLDPVDLVDHAAALGLDAERVWRELADGVHVAALEGQWRGGGLVTRNIIVTP